MLVEEHQPHSRARSLQLLNNVLHFRFDSKKTTQENILKFEETIEEYEKSSGDLVAEDMKISIILGGTEGNMRQHLLLNQKETTKYAGLRQYLLSYEQATRWTTTDLSTQERTTKDKQTWMLQEFTNGGKEKERTKESQKEKEKALESTAKEKEAKEKVTEKEKASTTKRAKDEEKEEEKEKEKAEDEDTAKAGAEDTTTKEKEKVTTTTTQEPTSATTARSLGTTKPIADSSRETCRTPGTYRRMMSRAREHKPQQFQAAAPQQQPQEQLQRSLQQNLQYDRSPCTT